MNPREFLKFLASGAAAYNREPGAFVPGATQKSAPTARPPSNPTAQSGRPSGRSLARPAASGRPTPEIGLLTAAIAQLTLKIGQLTPGIVQITFAIGRLTLEIVQLTPEIVQLAAAIGGPALEIVQLAPAIGQVAGKIGRLAAAGRGSRRAKRPFAAGGGPLRRILARPARNFLVPCAKIIGKCRAWVHLCSAYLTLYPPCLHGRS